MKIEHHEITVDAPTFREIMETESLVEGMDLHGVPVSKYHVIGRLAFRNIPISISKGDTLAIRLNQTLDGVTGLATRVLSVDKDSIKIIITAKLFQNNNTAIEPQEPTPENLDCDAFEQLYTRFGELHGNPFAVERELGHNRSTIFKYLNLDGTPTIKGQQILDGSYDR